VTGRLRRRFRTWRASHDWFEGISVILGVLFFVAAAVCVWGFVVALGSLGDAAEPGLARVTGPLSGSSSGTVHATRWFAIVLFGLLAVLTAAVGWFLSGDAIERSARRMRGRA
jgi:hypothetical protein